MNDSKRSSHLEKSENTSFDLASDTMWYAGMPSMIAMFLISRVASPADTNSVLDRELQLLPAPNPTKTGSQVEGLHHERIAERERIDGRLARRVADRDRGIGNLRDGRHPQTEAQYRRST